MLLVLTNAVESIYATNDSDAPGLRLAITSNTQTLRHVYAARTGERMAGDAAIRRTAAL
jgi:hypothetical protein